MKLSIDGKQYHIALEDNETAREIAENLPLELEMERYAGHEYYAELPFTPPMAGETTSEILAGHVYYWDGWNAFVINYIDSDISPYQVVHVGAMEETEISEDLENAENKIAVHVE
ncbi:MAG: cyclophilin-like fold protein [Eubacteriales bacterium]|nr:cyclophilin-like fold protein [Eubacteriales bacterium]